MVLGGLLVVPRGLVDKMAGRPAPSTDRSDDTQLAAAQARAIVMETERRLGFEPTEREFDKLGYDIESRVPATGKLRFIEVKGRRSDADTVTVTKNGDPVLAEQAGRTSSSPSSCSAAAATYEHGDCEVAVSWFRRAAEQGHAPAQAALGYMYSAGRGVGQDHEVAVSWFRSTSGGIRGMTAVDQRTADDATGAARPWCRSMRPPDSNGRGVLSHFATLDRAPGRLREPEQPPDRA